jgi:succinyl-diaminopimelate desuccinylase
MKTAIAAWIAATAAAEPTGSLSLLITGDEEGPAIDGTRRVVEALQAEGERIDACVVGEPSSAETLGDMIKVGRRGSLNAWITVEGVQGHVAYPHRAANPVPVLIRLLARLQDRGAGRKAGPSSSAPTWRSRTVDIGNPATNIDPRRGPRAPEHPLQTPPDRGPTLAAWIEREGAAAGESFGRARVSARCRDQREAFLTEPGPFNLGCGRRRRGRAGRGAEPLHHTVRHLPTPRFFRALCPVVELGLVGKTIHSRSTRSRGRRTCWRCSASTCG